MFDQLKRTTCEQIDRRGVAHEVKLLPVVLLDRYYDILAAVGEHPESDRYAAARRDLRELAMRTLPPCFAPDLLHLDFSLMCRLVAELFFGPERHTGKSPVREAEDKRELDMEFAAARMLNVYPGYTLEALLNLPAPVFFRLLELSGRVKADKALMEVLPAVNAAVNGGPAARAIFRDHGGYFIDPAESATYTDAELAAAYARSKQPQKVLKSVRIGQIIE